MLTNVRFVAANVHNVIHILVTQFTIKKLLFSCFEVAVVVVFLFRQVTAKSRSRSASD